MSPYVANAIVASTFTSSDVRAEMNSLSRTGFPSPRTATWHRSSPRWLESCWRSIRSRFRETRSRRH